MLKMAVHDVIYTTNPMDHYEFTWTIENFSTVPEVFQGPLITPIPGFLENFNFELRILILQNRDYTFNNYFDVNLRDSNDKTSHFCVTSGHVTLCNTNGDVIIENKISYKDFKKHLHLLNYTTKCSSKHQLSKVMNLIEDKLIVKGTLTFSGYDMTSRVLPPTVKDNSKVSGDLVKDLKKMYESGSSYDITFNIGEQTLSAHKTILRCRSPVFAKMFDSDMLENNTNKVFIEDSDFHSFNYFLMFLYTGIVEDKSWNTVLSLYALAHKYQVQSLQDICSGILGKGLAIDSVCSVLVLADLHGDTELKDMAKIFIRDYIEVVGTNEWADKIIPRPQLVKEVLALFRSQSAIK